MNPERYAAFTEAIVSSLRDDHRVLAVVALGSTAGTDRDPDEWSDHDLWIVTVDGAAPELRDDRTWLPDPERIVVHVVETIHGRQVVYDDGHLVEIAVFDDRELEIAAANAHRVLLDRDGVAERVRAIADRTTDAAADEDPRRLLGRFVAQLTIGLNRAARGETTSANQLVRGAATRTLAHLVALLAEPEERAGLDDLDPARRFELAFPEVATDIEAAVRLDPIGAAEALVAIARPRIRALAGADAAIGAVTATIDRCRGGRSTPPA